MLSTIRFRRIHPAAIIPTYATPGSVAMDIHIIGERDGPARNLRIPPKTTVIARTGLGIAYLSKGRHVELVLRSSTCIKYPGLVLANGQGIIDEDYCGPEDEIFVPLRNTTNYATYELPLGSRIAQLILRSTHRAYITELEYEGRLDNGDRASRPSRGGLGSTGG